MTAIRLTILNAFKPNQAKKVTCCELPLLLHRGIAARQFQRAFVLAEGIEVSGANLENGLLEIDLIRIQPERIIRKISIKSGSDKE